MIDHNSVGPADEWVPVYIGKRRGRCSTRKHKTHNKKAVRWIRRHGDPFVALLQGEVGRIGGITITAFEPTNKIELVSGDQG